ncbi:hypothetical protein Pan216_30140 [Planctomycetes bacterium Pan216]|uniref:Uncharacterized protein n=1 Tax=Kolteria novifilia TaxID=2527975 RepID=A0A518B595_9BACT|nr:hypothetical protein Pan216_30140 [Planctomycetes bacterium Pan216]
MSNPDFTNTQKSGWLAAGVAIGSIVASMFQIQLQVPIKLDLATRIVELKTRNETTEVAEETEEDCGCDDEIVKPIPFEPVVDEIWAPKPDLRPRKPAPRPVPATNDEATSRSQRNKLGGACP